MRPSQLADALASVLPSKVPVFLHGPPGVGKSSVARQAAQRLNGEFLDVRLPYHDPSDIKFPVVDVKAKTIHWINSLFPKDPNWRGIICLEELPQCAPLMQALTMQVTLDRCVGEYKLPDQAFVLACGNRQEDRAAANRIITPVLNRFIHLDLEVDHDDWQTWAVDAGVVPEVRSFLRFRPGLLFPKDWGETLKTNPRAFNTPRSWHFVSQVLPSLPAPALFPVVAGTVGDGPAAEFIAYLRICRELPDIDALLKAPASFVAPRHASVLYALCGALSEKARTLDPQGLESLATVAGRLPQEFGVLLMTDSQGQSQAAGTVANGEVLGEELEALPHRSLTSNLSTLTRLAAFSWTS